ncbi:integral membrane protein, partial [Streptomyces coelicoflavus ZG0656]
MGIESDQVVFEYLSRVGDVAQQRQLPSATRMRLVSELRNEIDRHRAKTTVDSPAAVRRILDRLGEPDDIVTAAGGTSGVRDQAPAPTAVPEQRDPGPRDAERR